MKYSLRNKCDVEFAGLPIWSIAIGPDEEKGEKSGTAKGIVAIGDSATGVIAIGYAAKGIISVGIVSIGIFAIGILSIGLFTTGLLSLALLSAKGFCAASLYQAAGVFSVGYEAQGSVAYEIRSLF